MKRWGLVAILVLAGCPHPKPPPATSDRCAGIAAHVYVSGEGDPSNQAAIDAIADACRRDAWSTALIDCMGKVDNLKEDESCTSTMSEQQGEDLERAFDVGHTEAVQAPPAYGTWDGDFTFELAEGSIHATGSGWEISGAYTAHDDGTMTFDTPTIIQDAKDSCSGSIITGPLCDPPDLSCMRVDEAAGDNIKISYGATCDHLDGVFTGSRH